MKTFLIVYCISVVVMLIAAISDFRYEFNHRVKVPFKEYLKYISITSVMVVCPGINTVVALMIIWSFFI